MYSIQENRTYPRTLPLLLVITGALVSILVSGWALHTQELKWAMFIILGLMFPFVMMIARGSRRFVLALLLFAIPLNADVNFMMHPSTGGADAFTLGLTDIMLFFLAGQTFFQVSQIKRRGAFSMFPAIFIPSIALLISCALSLLAAKDLLWSSFDLLNLAKTILFFIVLANNIRSKEDLTLVLKALFIGLLLQASIVVFQLQVPTSAETLQRFGLGAPSRILSFEMDASDLSRPGGTVGHVNHLARYIGLLLPIAFILTITMKQRHWKVWAGFTTLIAAAVLATTLTRSSWLGAGISIFLMIPWIFARRLFSFRTLGLFAAVGVLAFILMAPFAGQVLERFFGDDGGSAMTRITTSQVAWEIIQDHPIIGVGINNYGSVLPDYWDVHDRFTRLAAVHNTYLLYAAELGLIGIGIYAWLLIALFIRINRAIRAKSTLYATVAIGIMGSFWALLATALSDKSYKENFSLMLLFWALAAIIEAIIRLDNKDRENAEIFYSNRNWTHEL